jgi:septal ring factor EnvC (AmiA/AmiB activator)
MTWKRAGFLCLLLSLGLALPAQSCGYWVSAEELQLLEQSLKDSKAEIERLQSELLALRDLFNQLGPINAELLKLLENSETSLLKALAELKSLSETLKLQQEGLKTLSDLLMQYENERLLLILLSSATSLAAVTFLLLWLCGGN